MTNTVKHVLNFLCSFPTKLTPRRSVPHLLKRYFACPSFVFFGFTYRFQISRRWISAAETVGKNAVDASCDSSMLSRNLSHTQLPPIFEGKEMPEQCPLSPARTYQNFAEKYVHGELCFRIAFYNKDSGGFRVSRNAHRSRVTKNTSELFLKCGLD